ncbi:phosphatase PAP2 family protein [Salinicola rhizosphaerae]|uniref:undecaprenyl-diphosphate phosphatase n=1 Tax=Salinicola rhizosphaerae TaxID=1443141 RepID=A0ABQ3DZL9_9GAMM|nr:phosphatase PAP2 family protein [Salinicola rhizosphaerae]GHB18546.1 undecaprenyl-diphosphatase [Salinicola rhizosphaerae]
MEALNLRLFDWLNAPLQAPHLELDLAYTLAIYAIYLVPLLMIVGWLRRDPTRQRLALQALLACVLALGVNEVIALLWQHPRPFVISVGHTYLDHAPNSSFPSDHMTIISTVAITLLLSRDRRRLGVAFAAIALGIAWSRVYLGVHFPLDMLGAVGVSVIVASTVALTADRYLPTLHTLARAIHRRLFGPLIARGWLPE